MDSRLRKELERTDARAKRLRAFSVERDRTEAEALLAEQLPGFLTQVVLLDYIVDFLEPNQGVAVEINGAYYSRQTFKDWKRDRELYEALGVCVFRVAHKDVEVNPVAVAGEILNWIPVPVPAFSVKLLPPSIVNLLVDGEVRRFMAMWKSYPRSEVVQGYDKLQWRDTEYDLLLRKKLNKIISHWPTDGYSYWY